MAETYKELQEVNNQNFSDNPTTTSQVASGIPVQGIPVVPKNRGNSNTAIPIDPNQGVDIRNRGSSYLMKKMAGDDIYKEQNMSTASPFASDYFNTKVWGIDLGEVTSEHKNKYGGLSPFSKAVDFEHHRRDSQGAVSAGFNLFNQFLGKTAVNTVGGIVAGFYGLGSAAINADASKIFDNEVTRGLDKATDWVDENNSVFTSQRGRDNAILGFFSFEMTKDIGDAFSFISGAILSTMAVGGVANALRIGSIASKGLDFAGTTLAKAESLVGLNNGINKTGNIISRAREFAKLSSSVDPADAQKLQQLIKAEGALANYVDDAARHAKILDGLNNTVKGTGNLITGTFWEAGLEARHAKDDFISSQLETLDYDLEGMSFESEEAKQRYKNEQIAKIEEMGDRAGLITFGLNTAVLKASNSIQFPTIFGTSAKKGVDGMDGVLTRKGIKDYVASGGKASDILGTVASVLKAPATEFMEETLQGAISKGANSYYETMFGTRTSSGELIPGVSNASDAIINGLKETYGTKEGIYEGVIGAIVGGMGAPTIGKNKKGKLRPKFEGGVAEAFKERAEAQESVKEALASMNSDTHGTLLSYNKDNTIISLQDAKKETVASLNGDVHEQARLKDNIVFRYVAEKLDKGMKSFMDEDVAEINGMDLETYISKMGKSNDFSEEEMKAEKEAFTKKVGVYTNAYEKVYKGLEMDRINNNRISKKYFDTLVYSVANEKILKDRQSVLSDDLLTKANLDLTKEEIIQNAKSSERFKNHEKEIDDLIKLTKLEKEAKFSGRKQAVQEKIDKVKERISQRHKKQFDESIDGKEDNLELFDRLLKEKERLKSQDSQIDDFEMFEIFKSVKSFEEVIAEQERLQKTIDKETKVNTGNFGPIRTLKDGTKRLLDKISKEIEEDSSKTLNELRGKKDSITLKELEDYLELKQKVKGAISASKKSNNKSILDELNDDEDNSIDIDDTLNELRNITKHQTMAFEIASALYGLDKSGKAYESVANAQFLESISNLNKMYDRGTRASMSKNIDEASIISAEMEVAIKNVREDLEEYSDLIRQEVKDEVNKGLDKVELLKASIDEMINRADAMEEAATAAIEAAKAAKLKKEVDDISNLESQETELETDEELKEEGIIDNVEFDNSEVTGFAKRNVHTIKTTNSKNPDLIEMKAKLEDGRIKHNSTVVASYLESNEETEGFKGYLKNDPKKPDRGDVTEAYLSGKAKVIEDPTVLDKELSELDPDVITYITYFPANMDIFNKPVELFNGRQVSDVNSDDSPEQSFLYFSEDVTKVDNKSSFEFNKKKKEIQDKVEADLNEIERLLNGTPKVTSDKTEESILAEKELELKTKGDKLIIKVHNFEIKDSQGIVYVQGKYYQDGSVKLFKSEKLDSGKYINDKNPQNLKGINSKEDLIENVKEAASRTGFEFEDKGEMPAKEAGFNAYDALIERYDNQLKELKGSNDAISEEKLNKEIAEVERRKKERLNPISESNPNGYFETFGVHKKDKTTGEEYYDPDVKNGKYSADFSEDFDVDDFIEADSVAELKNKINAKYDAEIKTLKSKKTTSTEETKISQDEYNKRKYLIERQYEKDMMALESTNKLILNNTNSLVLFTFRKALLYNKYNNDTNELNMRLMVNDGALEKAGDTSYDVEEYSLTSDNGEVNFLFKNLSDLTAKDFVFGNQEGDYISFDNEKRVQLNEGSKVVKRTASTGAFYVVVETQNGRKIPVLLNRRKIGESKVVYDEIMHQVEEYFKNGMERDKILVIKDPAMSAFNMMSYKDFFESFFKLNRTSKGIYDIDSLNLVSGKGDKAGVMYLGNLDLEINGLETFEQNRAEIENSIADMRFFLNKSSLKDGESEFSSDKLKLFISEKLINHSMNSSTNRDKIFKPESEKSMQLHILDTQVNKLAKDKKPKVKQVKNTLTKLLGRKGKENMSKGTVAYNIGFDIITAATPLWRETGDATQSIMQAFEQVLENKLQQARDLIASNPNEYTIDEETYKTNKDIKLLSTDKTLDTFFKIVYMYKNKFQGREQTVKAFSEFLENKDYAVNYKKVLLAKGNVQFKMMIADGFRMIDGEQKDGKIESKKRPKFSFNKELTSGTAEENREKFVNIIRSFSRLQKSAEMFVPKIFSSAGRENAETSKAKVFMNFSKGFMNNKGEVGSTNYFHEIDNEGNVSKGTNKSRADGDSFNLAQTNPKFYNGEKNKFNQAFKFTYLNSKGEEVETNTPEADFEFDAETGVLKNGFIYMSYYDTFKTDKGMQKYVATQAVLIGSDNNLGNNNNYISTISIPGLRDDFSNNEDHDKYFNKMMSTFESSLKNVIKESSELLDPKSAKESVTIKEDEEELKPMKASVLSSDEDIKSLTSGFLASVTPKEGTSEPKEPTSVAEQKAGGSLASLLTDDDTDSYNNNSETQYTNKEKAQKAGAEKAKEAATAAVDTTEAQIESSLSLSADDDGIVSVEEMIAQFEAEQKAATPSKKPEVINKPELGFTPTQRELVSNSVSIIKASMDRHSSNKSADKEWFMKRNDKYGVDNYKKAIEMLDIVYGKDSGNKDKMINFVNELFKKSKKDSDAIIKC